MLIQKKVSCHKWVSIQSISHIILSAKTLSISQNLGNIGIREKTPQYPHELWKPPHSCSSIDFPSECKTYLLKSLLTTIANLLGLFCINNYLLYKREMRANMNLKINKHKI